MGLFLVYSTYKFCYIYWLSYFKILCIPHNSVVSYDVFRAYYLSSNQLVYNAHIKTQFSIGCMHLVNLGNNSSLLRTKFLKRSRLKKLKNCGIAWVILTRIINKEITNKNKKAFQRIHWVLFGIGEKMRGR